MKLSVLIAVYNYPLINLCLNGFLSQEETDFEICLTNDGGDEDYLIPILKKYENKLNIIYQYLYPPNTLFRAGQARNLSASKATGDRYAITDSDCIVRSDFVREHSKQTGVCIGVRRHIPINIVSNLTEDTDLNSLPYGLDPRINMPLEDATYLDLSKYCWGCNISFDAVKFQKIGGFDEWFVEWGCEDVELGLRMYQIGEPFKIKKDLAVWHMDHYTRKNVASQKQYDNHARYFEQVENVDFLL